MFTQQDIDRVNLKVSVKTSFVQYVRDLIEVGVLKYRVYVSNGRRKYSGRVALILTESEYPSQPISAEIDLEKFKDYLKMHQQGKTTYLTFCKHAAQTGVHSWLVDTTAKTCTYYDVASNVLLVEDIPL